MNILHLIIVLVIIVGSVILHELAHGYVAFLLGDQTAKNAGRLTLNPLEHIDPYMSILVPVVLYLLGAPVFGGAKPVPIDSRNLKWREWGLALVGIAGPATNFLLALIAFLIGHFTGLIGFSSGSIFYLADNLPAFIVVEIIVINLGFMIFNLIPIPPLDGSRVLYAFAPDVIRDYMVRLEPYGFIIVYALILVFGQLFTNIMISGIDGVLSFFNILVGN